MKQIFVTLLLFNIFSFNVFSQKSLSDYAYVLVPQQFEFQRGTNQYQVNTLVRHLFREAGFNSIYDVELKGLPRCDGLFADLIYDSSMFQTTFTVVLKDCNNNVVYLSDPGTSKEKDYRLGYHEAIRRAFRSIENLDVRQGDLDAFRESLEKKDAPIVTPQKIEVKPATAPEIKIETSNLPTYTHDGVTYFLEAKNDGYVLYRKRGEAILTDGTLSKTSRSGMYLFNKDGKSMLASFDTDNNLIIDNEDNDGKPSQNVFVKVTQE